MCFSQCVLEMLLFPLLAWNRKHLSQEFGTLDVATRASFAGSVVFARGKKKKSLEEMGKSITPKAFSIKETVLPLY